MHRLWYDLRIQSMFDARLRESVLRVDAAIRDMIWRIVTRYGELADRQPAMDPASAYGVLDGLFQAALLGHVTGDSQALRTLVDQVARADAADAQPAPAQSGGRRPLVLSHAQDPAPYLAAPTQHPSTRPPLAHEGLFCARQTTEQQDPAERGRAMETNDQEQATYDVHAVEQKWRQVWDGLDAFRAGSAPEGAEKRYALTMFPYPSGDLHMGHAEVMALHDVIARYWWQRGYDVLNPMGWDSFGLPAENAAIRNDEHPATYTYANIDTQYESFRNYAISFDWSRRFNTSDPEYYTWTQWLFLKFRERGLAYRKNSPVNWCPNDQTVLANEQVVDGRCERCGARGDQARADPVVLQDHRLRAAAAGRHGAAGGHLAGAGADRPAQLDRPLRGRPRRLRRRRAALLGRPDCGSSRPARTRCSVRRSWWSPPDAQLAQELCHRRAEAGAGGLPGRGAQVLRDRATGHRPAQDRRRPGRHRDQPGQRRADPGLGLGLRAGRLRHRRDHGVSPARTSATGSSPTKFGLPIIRTIQPPGGLGG